MAVTGGRPDSRITAEREGGKGRGSHCEALIPHDARRPGALRTLPDACCCLGVLVGMEGGRGWWGVVMCLFTSIFASEERRLSDPLKVSQQVLMLTEDLCGAVRSATQFCPGSSNHGCPALYL